MAKELAVNPARCTGCSTCSLTCSITNGDEFNPKKAHVKIRKHDFTGVFEIMFSSACKGCKQCALTCPSGALRVIEAPDPEPAGHGEGGKRK